ncbi:MAG: hypothetical protein JOY68_04025, partial [Candidatus Dormibacteraeota bacterium]|nr:hypothetical protein [Candidatus Dormibacteraeota bacterium]
MLTTLLVALAAIAWLLFLSRPVLVAARMFQIEEYERRRFLSWGIGAAWTAHRAVLVSAGVTGVALVLAAATRIDTERTVAAGWFVASLLGASVWRWLPPKKRLVITARMRRLLATVGLLAALLAVGMSLLLVSGWWIAAAVLVLVPLSFTSRLAQLLLVVADLVDAPLEAGVRRSYLRRAAERIGEWQPYAVAVAGSYGKTSTKHILAALLQPSTVVLPTRKSFNTLMGVTRVINEDLEPSHRVFIVEMDAYAPGEIAAMCRLVHPRIAVVTSVGPQHLERFQTLQHVEDALFEAVESLPPEGTAIVYAGDATSAAMAERARHTGRTVLSYGISDGAARFDVEASDVLIDGEGARFTWRFAARAREHEVRIPLLGRHQVLNVTAALAAVAVLDADLDAAVVAARGLQPV